MLAVIVESDVIVSAAVQSVWSLGGLEARLYVCVDLNAVVCVQQGNNIPQYYHTDDISAVQTVHITSSELPASGQ